MQLPLEIPEPSNGNPTTDNDRPRKEKRPLHQIVHAPPTHPQHPHLPPISPLLLLHSRTQLFTRAVVAFYEEPPFVGRYRSDRHHRVYALLVDMLLTVNYWKHLWLKHCSNNLSGLLYKVGVVLIEFITMF
jgi:hypothetical protein